MKPAEIVDEIKASGLVGRGGAAFPTGIKWEGAAKAPGAEKYVICNADESEPGTFKDRILLIDDPHRTIEGMLITGYAIGARKGYIYIRAEYPYILPVLENALKEANEADLLGENILESGFAFDIELRVGAGAYICGEETALFESIEGKRGFPRVKPPFPTTHGLFGKPTVINNVETLFAVPLIAERGAEWWTALGRGHGTKCFGLSGHVARPGLVEVEVGATLRDLIERIGGGVPGGRALKGAVLGGPSGIIVPPRDLDEPLLPGGRVNPGTGGIVALDETVSIRDVVKTLLDFNTRESCGKCTPCREGTARLRDMLDRRGPLDAAAVAELSEVVRVASLCGLGQAAPLSMLSALREFAGELR
jgi:NADH:ubiquinone oxidoreductase subunit F (NADH-binding)